jgi:hypothetical protein
MSRAADQKRLGVGTIIAEISFVEKSLRVEERHGRVLNLASPSWVGESTVLWRRMDHRTWKRFNLFHQLRHVGDIGHQHDIANA